MGRAVDEIAKDAPSKHGPPAAEHPTTPRQPAKESVDAQSLAGIFGMRGAELSPKEKEKINAIVSWVRKSDDDLDLAWALVQKRNQLGSPRIGTSVLDHMYQWYRASIDYEESAMRLRQVELGNA